MDKLTIPEDVIGMNPWENPYDPYGRGASPRTALLFEALRNAISPGSITDRIPTSELIRKGMFVIDPKFLDENYQGSGTSFTGGPLRGKIALSTNRSWQDMLREILEHENIHRNTGSMGGYQYGNQMPDRDRQIAENWLMKLGENPQSYPQERMAYSLGRDLFAPRKYYIQGDINKALPDYLSDWQYSERK